MIINPNEINLTSPDQHKELLRELNRLQTLQRFNFSHQGDEITIYIGKKTVRFIAKELQKLHATDPNLLGYIASGLYNLPDGQHEVAKVMERYRELSPQISGNTHSTWSVLREFSNGFLRFLTGTNKNHR